jgi:E3 SUMO-protein ligase RanBP2
MASYIFVLFDFSVFCANATQDEQQTAGYWSPDRPVTLPANITEQLCTVSQAKWYVVVIDEESNYRNQRWHSAYIIGLPDFSNLSFCYRWTAAYKVYTNQAKGDLGELRQTLQRGIEVVRVLGNHGLHIRLIVHLARTFERRVSIVFSAFEDPDIILAPTKTISGFYY